MHRQPPLLARYLYCASCMCRAKTASCAFSMRLISTPQLNTTVYANGSPMYKKVYYCRLERNSLSEIQMSQIQSSTKYRHAMVKYNCALSSRKLCRLANTLWQGCPRLQYTLWLEAIRYSFLPQHTSANTTTQKLLYEQVWSVSQCR